MARGPNEGTATTATACTGSCCRCWFACSYYMYNAACCVLLYSNITDISLPRFSCLSQEVVLAGSAGWSHSVDRPTERPAGQEQFARPTERIGYAETPRLRHPLRAEPESLALGSLRLPGSGFDREFSLRPKAERTRRVISQNVHSCQSPLLDRRRKAMFGIWVTLPQFDWMAIVRRLQYSALSGSQIFF